MRNADPIGEAIPIVRRIAAAVVLVLGGTVLLGYIPLDAQTFGLTLIVIGVGLMA